MESKLNVAIENLNIIAPFNTRTAPKLIDRLNSNLVSRAEISSKIDIWNKN